MKRILPLADTPIKCYHYHADILSVVLNHQEASTWLYNNYIQLTVNTNFRADFYFPYSVWKACPFVYYQRVSRAWLTRRGGSLTDFLRENIDVGNYPYLEVDEYYIPKNRAYKTRHNFHDLFIYGYDDEQKIFHIVSYNENKQYIRLTVDYQTLETAYEEAPPLITQNYQGNGIELICWYPRDHALNIPLIRRGIRDYLDSVNSYEYIFPNDIIREHQVYYTYGMSVYDAFQSFLQECVETGCYLDYRFISVICEHKELMSDRIRHLGELGYLANAEYIYAQYRKVVKNARKAKMLLLKLYTTFDKRLVNRVMAPLEQAAIWEREILEYLLTSLSDTRSPLLAVSIGEKREDLPYRINRACKPGERFTLPSHPPIRQAVSSRYIWSYDSCVVSLVEENDDHSVWEGLVPGQTELSAITADGEHAAHCRFHCVHPGFISNIPGLKPTGMFWREVDNGAEGVADQTAALLSSEIYDDGQLEADITLLSTGGAMLVTRAAQDLSGFTCVVMDADGMLKVWEPADDLIKIPTGIRVGETFRFVLHLNGSLLTIFLNGKEICQFSHMQALQGYIGLQVAEGAARFQNVNWRAFTE